MSLSIALIRSSRAVFAARIWYAAIAFVISAAFVIQLVVLIAGGADANSGTTGVRVSIGVRLVRLFSYFTIESNLIVLAVAITLLIRPDRDGPVWRVVRLDALLGIVITGLVFAIVLAPGVHLTGAAQLANIGFHYIAPWATLLAWIVFGPRPRIGWNTIAGAFIWPVLWIIYTFAHGAATGWYPYPFLDAATKGYAAAFAGTAAVVLTALALSVAFKCFDRLPVPGYLRSRG